MPTYPRTPEEVTANVTPTNDDYPFGDVRRYGAVLVVEPIELNASEIDAVATGNNDAIDTWLSLGGGYLPVGGICLINRTIAVPNLARCLGSNTTWSVGNGSKVFTFRWAAPVDPNNPEPVMFQVSAAALGTPTSSARTGVHLAFFTIQGMDIAAVGLFGNYVTNESEIHHITVTGCNRFAILASKLWYSKWHDLTARDCKGWGIAFGYNYQNTFDVNDVNAVCFRDLRATRCGERYNSANAPLGFSLANNPRGGCGIYLCLKVSSSCYNVLGELNYGPGIVIEPNSTARCNIHGIYLEGNMSSALADGETSKRYGMVLVSSTTDSGLTKISGVYTAIGSTPNNNIYYYHTASATTFHFDYIHGNVTFDSNTTGVVNISVTDGRGGHIAWNGIEPVGTYTAKSLQVMARGEATGSQIGGIVQNAVTYQASGWASGTTLTVAEVTLRPLAPGRSSCASLLVHIGAQAQASGNQSKFAGLYVVTLLVGFRGGDTSTGETDAKVTLLDADQSNLGGTLLTMGTPTVSFSSSGTPATVVAKITVTPTSTGAQTNNGIVAATTMMGGGVRSGANPTLTLSLHPDA